MKHLLVLLLLLCSMSVSAQDVIVKKDGSTILSKVLEVGQEEVKYKKFDNLEGPTYSISKSELQAINYKNGAKDTFSKPVREENRYLPNNQNDGTQKYNDRALLAMDDEAHPRMFKWNIKAGLSVDKMTGSGAHSITDVLGYDCGFGVFSPLKRNWILGADVFIASYNARFYREVLSTIGLGIMPYLGYKFPVGKNMALIPYLGPSVSFNNKKSTGNGVGLKSDTGLNLGFDLGADFFISSNFYIDLHFRKGFKTENFRQYWSGGEKNYDLSPMKFVLGIGVLL